MNKFRSTIPGGVQATGALSPANDHRDEVRHRLAHERASIDYEGETLEVDLINLSGGGAMIEGDIRPSLWDRVDLRLGAGNPIECAVRWLRGERIGLEFAHETQIDCAPEDRDALLLDVIRRSFPDVAAPANLSPAEVEAAADEAPRRAARRHPLIWNGKIEWQRQTLTVRLRNISASGVLIDTPIDLTEGARLVLDMGKSGHHPAAVGWSRSGQAGLVFDAPFEMSRLAAARPEVAAPSWQRPAYLDRPSDDASAEECGWDRSALADLRADLEGFLKY